MSGFFWLIFSRIGLALAKHCLSCIHYKSLATRVYYHVGCTEYCKNFTVALKMINVIDKKQMHDSVNTGNEYASKDWTCVISMFWRVLIIWLMSILSVVVHVLCVYASKLLSGFFGTRYGFFGEDRLATLLCSLADSILQSGVCASQSSCTPMFDCSYWTRH